MNYDMIKTNSKTTPIQDAAVYTLNEVQQLLKISPSTFKRLIKNGLIRANKIGGQYRILGSELLRMLSPDVEDSARKVYRKVKAKTVEMTRD